jgi:adenylosuccinate lyase
MIERYTRPEMARLWTDEYRFEKMLEVELLAAEALVKKKVVPASALKNIRAKAKINVARIRDIEKEVKHDVIAFVTAVAETVGEDAKRYLHFGLTSSDVLDTALAVQMVEAADLLLQDLADLQKTVAALAKAHEKTLMIGRSHGIHGEPITFGFKVAGWYSELQRSEDRIKRARQVAAFGSISGAMGTFAHLDPSVEAYVCEKLGLKPEPAATQVIPRDRHAEYCSMLAIVAAGIERIATEIRHLQRTEVLEAEEPFSKGQKGSSAMPHKRNPIASENLCGLARLVRTNALASLENIALWHERDISHSSVERVILPDSTILLDFMIMRLNNVLRGLQVYPQNMKRNMLKTVELIASQRLLLALVDKGLGRDESYRKVQSHAMQAWEGGDSFKQLVLADPEFKKYLTPAEVDSVFDPEYYVRHVKEIIKRSGI